VSGERFLIVRRSLHRLQSRFQIAPNLPPVRPLPSGEPHCFESHKSCRQRLLADCREPAQARTRGVRHHPKGTEVSFHRLTSRNNQPIQWREALQRNLPAKCECGILLRSMAELQSCEMLRNGSKAVPDVIPIQPELLAFGVEASQRNVDVWMSVLKCATATQSSDV
jgi:hypothetical protein